MLIQEAIAATQRGKTPYIARKLWNHIYPGNLSSNRPFGYSAKVILTNSPSGCQFHSVFETKPWIPTMEDLMADDWEAVL